MIHQCNGRTDGRTQTELRWPRRATAVAAVARKSMTAVGVEATTSYDELVLMINQSNKKSMRSATVHTRCKLARQCRAAACELMGCLHDPANVQQTSSKCIQNTRATAGHLLEVGWIA